MSISSPNKILSRMAPDDLRLLERSLQPVTLAVKDDLELPNEPIQHIWFVESGLASMVAINAGGEKLEVGLFGREGVSGSTVIMGNNQSPHHCFIQVAGSAQRMTADDLRVAMQQSRSLHSLLIRYVQAFAIQTAHTALSNGRGKLEERLARWLLMSHDRMDGDELPLTHEFLALMLGVRRTGVTLALHVLEGQGLIRSRRGLVLIVDRDGLVETAAGSYGVPEAEYQRLMAH